MNDYISREIVAVGLALKVKRRDFDAIDLQDAQRFIASIPSADVRSVWIPVTERLPEEGRLVLAAFDDVVLVAFYGNYLWHDAGTFSVFYPTHWMPLPEPPKEG